MHNPFTRNLSLSLSLSNISYCTAALSHKDITDKSIGTKNTVVLQEIDGQMEQSRMKVAGYLSQDGGWIMGSNVTRAKNNINDGSSVHSYASMSVVLKK